jgi:FkbM family methyltransferase
MSMADPETWPVIGRKLRRGRVRRELRAANAAFDAALSRLAPGALCVDLGANLGDVSARLLAAGAEVHAFEPDPHCAAHLRARFAAATGFHLYEAAASVRDGRARLYRHRDFAADPDARSESSSLFAEKRNVDAGAAVDVAEIDVAAFLAGLGRDIAILKMDIEGAEVPVLEALLDAPVSARIDLIVAETHETRIPVLAARTAALRRRARALRRPALYLGWD